MRGVDGAGGVEVAVGLLGLAHFGYEHIQVSRQLLVRVQAERVRGALQRLVNVGVVEGKRGGELAALGRGHLEVLHPVGGLAALKRGRNGDGRVGFQARLPEVIGHLHLGEGHGLNGVVGALLGDGGRAQQTGDEEGGGKGLFHGEMMKSKQHFARSWQEVQKVSRRGIAPRVRARGPRPWPSSSPLPGCCRRCNSGNPRRPSGGSCRRWARRCRCGTQNTTCP